MDHSKENNIMNKSNDVLLEHPAPFKNKSILKNETQKNSIQECYSHFNFNENSVTDRSIELSPKKKFERSSKSTSPLRKSNSFKTNPKIPILANRADSIGSLTSLSPLGTSIPMTPTPVASKYDLRMYPHIMEYARIVHLSQREKQKAQARGENVQKWRLPQIPFSQSFSTQSQAIPFDETEFQVLNNHNGEGINNSPLINKEQEMHLCIPQNEQQSNSLIFPTYEQSKYNSSLPILSDSSTSYYHTTLRNNCLPDQTLEKIELPYLLRDTRLSAQNLSYCYPSKTNSIDHKITPLLHLGQSHNSYDVQSAALALRLYLQAKQKETQGINFDYQDFNSGVASVVDHAFQQPNQNKNLSSAYGDPQTLLPGMKHSIYLEEDLETLSPCSSSGEMCASLALFFNSPEFVGNNTSDCSQQGVQNKNKFLDTGLSVCFRTPSTPAINSQFNPSSPPTHLAAMNSFPPTPNVGSYYKYMTPTSALTKVKDVSRVATNEFWRKALSPENYFQLNSETNKQTKFLPNDKSTPLNRCWRDNDLKLASILSSCGTADQQHLLESNNKKLLKNYLNEVNAEKILDEEYYLKEVGNIKEIISNMDSGQCINQTVEKKLASANQKVQMKQENFPNDISMSRIVPPSNILSDEFSQMTENIPVTNVLECLSSNSIKNIRSHGSLFHPQDCKPCAFFWTKGCQNGQKCKFCHEWHAPKKKKPMKDQRNLMIIARPDGKIEYIRCSLSEALIACNVN